MIAVLTPLEKHYLKNNKTKEIMLAQRWEGKKKTFFKLDASLQVNFKLQDASSLHFLYAHLYKRLRDD